MKDKMYCKSCGRTVPVYRLNGIMGCEYCNMILAVYCYVEDDKEKKK